jgi:hypothetical protein
MVRNERGLVVFHGAAVLLLGLLCGLPAVVEELGGMPLHGVTWRGAHSALLEAGVWLLATAGVFPLLVLPSRQRQALCWSLLITAYAFTIAVLVQVMTGVRALSPSGNVINLLAYAANIVTVATGVLAALLTLLGAKAAFGSAE